MNGLDYAMLGIVALSALIGIARGLVREVLSLGVWIAALAIGWLFHGELAAWLEPHISQPALRLAIAFILLVLITLILGAILGTVLSLLIEKTGLSGVDRLLGLLFGALRGAVIVAMAVYLAALTPVTDTPWWQASQWVGQFQALAVWVLEFVPESVRDEFREL